MPPFTIRAATSDDAQAIAAIHVASWRDAYRGILPDEYLDSLSPEQRLPMWTRVLAPQSPPDRVTVAVVGDRVVGFAFIGPSDEGDPPDALMLYAIYLDPPFTRQGIGRVLMADVERRMRDRGATTGILRVITANARTRAFYEALGWTPDPASVRTEEAWGQQVETIRYTKPLQP